MTRPVQKIASLGTVRMPLIDAHRRILQHLAHASIEHGLAHHKPLPVDLKAYPPELVEKRASFVTLHCQGNLRGCIGTVTAYQPLATDVAYHAQAAAFADPRFQPLQREELSDLSIHVSVLSLPEPLAFTSEADLIRQLRPGVDGLILEEGNQRGTFLPAVWKSLPEPREFLQQLKRKAGFPIYYWSPQIKVFRYVTE